ncbi:hypothetical protein E2C01_050134 [Portunus trituberculatus]|uniref:Uncharacterized protein n=1 Tax=Portunus trituberculatus TaxID=210409 RepID=A0A5B7G868_PORTR|nr:hypothetical protein [Portunus trituberculatus]
MRRQYGALSPPQCFRPSKRVGRYRQFVSQYRHLSAPTSPSLQLNIFPQSRVLFVPVDNHQAELLPSPHCFALPPLGGSTVWVLMVPA